MSKERLEEIKENTYVEEFSRHTIKGVVRHTQATMNNDDYEWLIQQAERAGKLEENAQDLREALSRRQEQNKRYREAIDYVMTAEVTQYRSLENALEDIKFVINKTLESEK